MREPIDFRRRLDDINHARVNAADDQLDKFHAEHGCFHDDDRGARDNGFVWIDFAHANDDDDIAWWISVYGSPRIGNVFAHLDT